MGTRAGRATSRLVSSSQISFMCLECCCCMLHLEPSAPSLVWVILRPCEKNWCYLPSSIKGLCTLLLHVSSLSPGHHSLHVPPTCTDMCTHISHISVSFRSRQMAHLPPPLLISCIYSNFLVLFWSSIYCPAIGSYRQMTFIDICHSRVIAVYSGGVEGGGGMLPQGNFWFLGQGTLIRWYLRLLYKDHLKQFLKTGQRSVCCNCASAKAIG
jgi:hypothetical protein